MGDMSQDSSLQFTAGEDSMDGGGASVSRGYNKVMGAIKGYKDVTINGEVHRIYGMTKKEYMNWYNNRKRSAPVARRSSPPLRRSARIAERKRRASMGGKRRRSRKNKRTRKGRK
jgi:hypothetical protein